MPLLATTTTTARHLHLLLRTLSFTPKTHVHITPTGLRFSVDDSRAVQGLAFLDKALFTHYAYDASILSTSSSQAPDDTEPAPVFQLSLPALLETLQIFGALDAADRSGFPRDDSVLATGAVAAAFDARVLGMPASCRIVYDAPGSPLHVQLEEGNVRTQCSLTAYEPDDTAEDIPFDRGSVYLKVIMRSALLYDAVNELAALGPERVTIGAGRGEGSGLELSASGAYGTAAVAFAKDSPALETFQCDGRVRNSYKFAHVRHAGRAMASAAKVSVRVDGQGVLSCQFMVEVEEGGVSFVDFRFVPFVEEENESGGESEGS